MRFLLLLPLLLLSNPVFPQRIFTKGVNLTEWFQEKSVQDIQFNKYTKKDFMDIKKLGCDVIRLPINLHAMTTGAPNYIIEPLFFRFLDEAVSYAEELNLSLIIDNHTFDPFIDTTPDVEKILLKVWPQIVQRYKNRGEFLYYEILNEPHGIDPVLWGQIEYRVLKKIRQIDRRHMVIVGGGNWNDIESLNQLPDFQDDKIIYTFHFYQPFLFTHQGADWSTPSLASLKGVAYPYDKNNPPALPPELANTWIEQNILEEYPRTANDKSLEEEIALAAKFRDKTGKPVFCGEFGVYNVNAQNSHRVYWYQAVTKILNKYSIPRTSWDYQSGFGLFKKDSFEIFESDLNLPLLKALELNEIPQHKMEIAPETNGFVIFDQYPGRGMRTFSYISNGEINLYDDSILQNKNFAIRMENLNQYESLNFQFFPKKDLSLLVKNKLCLIMKIKADPGFKDMEIRFLSVSKNDPLKVGWRMSATLDEKYLTKTEDWQIIKIPLPAFSETGAWNDAWYDPRGIFDWTQIETFQIVAENGKWNNVGIYIAEIKISDMKFE